MSTYQLLRWNNKFHLLCLFCFKWLYTLVINVKTWQIHTSHQKPKKKEGMERKSVSGGACNLWFVGLLAPMSLHGGKTSLCFFVFDEQFIRLTWARFARAKLQWAFLKEQSFYMLWTWYYNVIKRALIVPHAHEFSNLYRCSSVCLSLHLVVRYDRMQCSSSFLDELVTTMLTVSWLSLIL